MPPSEPQDIVDNMDDMDDNDDYNAEQYFNDGDDDDLGADEDEEPLKIPLQPQRRFKHAGHRRFSTGNKRAPKRTKRDTEHTYKFGIDIVILKAKGESVAHVSKIEFEHVAKLVSRDYNEVEICQGVQIRQYNYDVAASTVHFLAHWILYRNPSIAIKCAMGNTFENTTVGSESLSQGQLLFLVRIINFFADESAFEPVIKKSLIACFAKSLKAQDQEGKVALVGHLKNACTDGIFNQIATDIFIALAN